MGDQDPAGGECDTGEGERREEKTVGRLDVLRGKEEKKSNDQVEWRKKWARKDGTIPDGPTPE